MGTFSEKKKIVFLLSKQPSGVNITSAAAVITIKNLLHGLVAHLSGRETLQGDDGGVGSVAQQQLAGLDVAGQCRSMEGCLPKGVHGVHLEPGEDTLAQHSTLNQTEDTAKKQLQTFAPCFCSTSRMSL